LASRREVELGPGIVVCRRHFILRAAMCRAAALQLPKTPKSARLYSTHR
jgi:hypothetical protein